MSDNGRDASPVIPVGGMPTRSGSVARTLLVAALVATALMALAFQFGIGDTVFNRPGELALLFVDVAPMLWFGAAAVLLNVFRWQSIDQRFRWVMLAAVVAALLSFVFRVLVLRQSWVEALLEPFTLGFLIVVAAAIAFTRTRVRRLARGTDAGITMTGIALGFAVVGAGVAIGSLRVALAGPPMPPGTVSQAVEFDPTTGLLIAATLIMIAALFWLADRTYNR